VKDSYLFRFVNSFLARALTKLRMKCSHCGCWNRIEVDKIFVPQPSPEPKVQVLIPMYKPLKTERCEKCGKVIAEPKELIRISARTYRTASVMYQSVFLMFLCSKTC